MIALHPATMDDRGRSSGFTLLETLVALTVLGFLLIGLNQGVRTGLGVWHAQARQIGTVAEPTSTARILRTLLAGVPIAPVASAAGGSATAIGFNGAADRLTFVGELPNGFGLARRANITLALKGERLVLSWTQRRHEPPDTPQPSSDAELLRGVADLRFAYFGVIMPGEPIGWVSQWDGPTLPELIRVELSFVQGDTRHWPDLIVAPQLALP